MINLQCINLSAAGGSGSGGGGQVATPNATIFGAPVINGSQVSGFTANDYLQMPRVIDFDGKQWQLDFQFTTGADVTTQQNIVDSGFGLAIAVSQGKMLVALSSNGTSWDLGAHAGTHAVAANTGYFVRMTFDGQKYIVAICTDGKTYETDITVTATASLFPRVILIGKSTDSRYIFSGIINLAEATLYIDGKEEWTGMTGSNYATKTEVKQLASELTELDLKVGALADLQTPNKESIVAAINSGLGKWGVISQTQTWASGYSGYTMSNQKYGLIPQANIDLFLSAGAEFNDTDAPIAKTAPWGETVQHLPGYFYWVGYGDISYEEMRLSYMFSQPNFSKIQEDLGCPPTTMRIYANINPNMKAGYIGDISGTVQNLRHATIGVYVLPAYKYNESTTFSFKSKSTSLMYNFYYALNIEHLVGRFDVTNVNNFTQTFDSCLMLKTIELKGVKASLGFVKSAWLSNSSILYMIQNSAATTPITITLHANAYARAIADAEIVAALEAHPLVSLASA